MSACDDFLMVLVLLKSTMVMRVNSTGWRNILEDSKEEGAIVLLVFLSLSRFPFSLWFWGDGFQFSVAFRDG
jgi:hypothetical protein